jgi:hypothetical protein
MFENYNDFLEPPTVVCNDDKYWYLNGELHRENGPAVEFSDGSKFWYFNGQYHREDGPAVEYANGVICWFYHGEDMQEKFHIKIESVEQYKKLISLLMFS